MSGLLEAFTLIRLNKNGYLTSVSHGCDVCDARRDHKVC